MLPKLSPSHWRTLGAALCFMLVACTALAQDKAIGEMARQATEAAKNAPVQANPTDTLGTLITSIQIFTLVTILLVTVLLSRVAKLTGFDPFKNWNSNLANARGFVLFFILFAVFLAWDYMNHAKYVLLGDSASAHGIDLDKMMVNTIIITFIVFVITQILLFAFTYLFRGRPGNVASHYHDNTKLELIWTGIPAVVLAFLVIRGVMVWGDIHKPAGPDALQVELVGQQFNWNVRYSGEDNKLGRANYKLIGGDNNLGIDFKDVAAKDDKVMPAAVLTLPKGRAVHVNVRAKDVLHGVYMPHFRVQVYAVPGMPTKFTFTPITTTEEMRAQTGNKDFNYEMACSQLCGSAHYNMRLQINVVTEEEYQKWWKAQTAPPPPAETKTAENDTKAVKVIASK